jgi:hypothetical protein
VSDSASIRILREFIEAVDRRLPQVQRVGEDDIARDAAALKTKALERLAELESEAANPNSAR